MRSYKLTGGPWSAHFNSAFWPCLWFRTTFLYFLPGHPSSNAVYTLRCTRRSFDRLNSYRDFSRDMSRPTRRNKILNQGYGVPGCDRVRMPRARSLLFCLLAVLVLALMLGVYLSNDTTGGHVDRMPTLDLARDRVRDVRANTRWCCIGRTGLCSQMC